MRKLISAAIVAMLCTGMAKAESVLKMATIAPSLSQAITMATVANVISSKLDDVTIEVAGGGAATLHMMEVARGNLDMSMTSPVVFNLMKAGKAMYAKQAEAPALSEKYKLMMWFPYGQYHFAVRADSDIQTLDDVAGATVFLGPQGGGAYNAAKGWIEATTGLVASEDYEAIKANWITGFQAFLDGTVDVYTNGCLDPCGQFIQFTETEPVRFIGPQSSEGEGVEKWLGNFRYREDIPADSYANQKNDSATTSMNTSVGIGVNADLDEDLVYRMTKAFWDNIDEVTSDAPWAKALDINNAGIQQGEIQLHQGAARYYKEVGAL